MGAHTGDCMGAHTRDARPLHRRTSAQRGVHTGSKTPALCHCPHTGGGGLGLRATQDCRSGDLLLCCPPLAIAWGAKGLVPADEALAGAMAAGQLEPQGMR